MPYRDPWDEDESPQPKQAPATPPPRPATRPPQAPAKPPAPSPSTGNRPYAIRTASNGGPKGPPSELYVTAVRRFKEDGSSNVFFNLSLGGPGAAKWGLDDQHWYNAAFWFNLDQLQDFLKSQDEISKNIGRGKVFEPKAKEPRQAR